MLKFLCGWQGAVRCAILYADWSSFFTLADKCITMMEQLPCGIFSVRQHSGVAQLLGFVLRLEAVRI